MNPFSLTTDALVWLKALRSNGRLRAKHIPSAIASELIEAKLARISGANVVITTAGMRISRSEGSAEASAIFAPYPAR